MNVQVLTFVINLILIGYLMLLNGGETSWLTAPLVIGWYPDRLTRIQICDILASFWYSGSEVETLWPSLLMSAAATQSQHVHSCKLLCVNSVAQLITSLKNVLVYKGTIWNHQCHSARRHRRRPRNYWKMHRNFFPTNRNPWDLEWKTFSVFLTMGLATRWYSLIPINVFS